MDTLFEGLILICAAIGFRAILDCYDWLTTRKDRPCDEQERSEEGCDQ